MSRPTKRLAELLILFVSANSALSQERVEVRVGQDVLLPCHYGNGDRPVGPDVSVFWRGRDDAHLYDIIAGQADMAGQDGRFRGRTYSFPDGYAKGNFSLWLREATQADSGRYTCHIPSLAFQQDVELWVTGQVAGDTRGADDSNRSHAATLRFDTALLLLGPTIFLLWRK